MNSATIPFTSNSAGLQFSPNRDGEYIIALGFLNKKSNDDFQRCEFSWLKDVKSKTECQNELIYKKMTLQVNGTRILRQYHYQDLTDHFGYGREMMADKIDFSLSLYKQTLNKNELINLKVIINTPSADILKDQAVLMIGPEQSFYYAGVSSGILLLIISIPILLSILYLLIKLRMDRLAK